MRPLLRGSVLKDRRHDVAVTDRECVGQFVADRFVEKRRLVVDTQTETAVLDRVPDAGKVRVPETPLQDPVPGRVVLERLAGVGLLVVPRQYFRQHAPNILAKGSRTRSERLDAPRSVNCRWSYSAPSNSETTQARFRPSGTAARGARRSRRRGAVCRCASEI